MFPTDLKLWYSKGVVREAVLLNLENLIKTILLGALTQLVRVTHF